MTVRARIIVLLVVLLAVVCTDAFAQQKDPVPAYLLSILLGFGTGHLYLDDGMARQFLILDAATLAATAVGGLVVVASLFVAIDSESYAGVYAGYGLAAAGAIAFAGSRIWEIVSTINTVDAVAENNKTAIKPSISATPGGRIAVGVSYQTAY